MEPFIGQIQVFGFSFAPRGWAKCEGQLLPINQYQALFSLLGTTYGGDGRTTFALPDFRGRVMIAEGTGIGLSNYRWGDKGGTEQTSLAVENLPAHHHSIKIPTSLVDQPVEKEKLSLFSSLKSKLSNKQNDAPINESGLVKQYTSDQVGQSVAFSNMQPYLVVSVCIALEGIYPSRS